jgi:hypothetical protein
MWDTALLWEIARNIGAGGFVLAMLLYLDERRERRQIQQVVRRMHAENIKYMRQLLRKSRASAANGKATAGSGRNKRRSMR